MAVPAGPLTGSLGLRPQAHIFVGSKAPWTVIADELPRHDAYPAAIDAPVLSTPAARKPSRGGVVRDTVRGSCLCGKVAFELSAPFQAAHHCHCSRCRRGRAAAHASNGFAPIDAIRFISGEAALRSYKPPEARRFTQCFCAGCGCIMPRLDTQRGIVGVPYGSLDDPQDGAPQDHIYTADKAEWFDIRDGLPCFTQGS